MAYCRFSTTCRVYMYASFSGYQFHLAGTATNKNAWGESFNIEDPHEALRRLKRLQTQGFGVPDYAIERLAAEIEQGET